MNIAVWYHSIISGGERNINTDYAMNLIASQMDALVRSGLMDAAAQFHVGVNGSPTDAIAVASFCDNKAQVTCHGSESRSEIPTLMQLAEWIKTHPDWYVLYHHTKGVSTPNQQDGWRRRMEYFMVWKWQDCVSCLNNGYDACGCHWLTPEQYRGSVTSPFFGGTFWWAKAKYLLTLPPLPPPTWANRYEAETWIGKAARRPRIYDFSPGWPSL